MMRSRRWHRTFVEWLIACPVSYCLSVTYNFSPKDLQVGEILEAIEY